MPPPWAWRWPDSSLVFSARLSTARSAFSSGFPCFPFPLAACRDDCTLAQARAARRLRYRILHPVRLHRDVHLRQFRAGARPAVAWHDGSRIRLFRLPTLDRHDASRRPGSRAIWHEARALGRARGSDGRLAADAVLAFEQGHDWHGAGRRRHVLRTSRTDPISRTARPVKPPTAPTP